MDTILKILSWFKGATIGINVKGVDIKANVGEDEKLTISVSGDIETVIDFIKGLNTK